MGTRPLISWHVTRMKSYHRVEILTAFLYALMFEELDIRIFKTYHYGDGYVFMLGNVSIVIALAWAVIIYSSMHISDCYNLSATTRACMDALLAVLIDLSIDAIAIRRGYWQWNIPLSAGLFGVAAGNLYAWMFVVFFFSWGCLQIRQRFASNRAWLFLDLVVPPFAYIALLISLVAVGTLNALLQLDERAKLLSVLAVMALFLIPLVRSSRQGQVWVRTPISPLIVVTRLGLHGFFIVELLRSGMWRHTPMLLVVATSVLLIEMAIQRYNSELGSTSLRR
jgi:hypothetical protein